MSQLNSIDIEDDVEPGVRSFIDSVNRAYAAHPGLADMPLSRRREIAEAIKRPWAEGGPVMAETREWYADGVRLRLHRPNDDRDLPVMLYVHGGGWTLFSIDTHDRLMREYAARSEVAVVGIDYSLSPEAKFPTALNQVVAALRWVRGHADELGVDAGRLAVGGDSAGANMAVSACLKLRQAGESPPQALLLNYGAFAPEPCASYERYDGPAYFLAIEEMESFWSNYTSDPAELSDPLIVPMRADLRGLPPTFLAIAECDILADCNHAFADRLAEAGVPVEPISYPGATHSFLEAVSVSELSRRALDDQARFLRHVL